MSGPPATSGRQPAASQEGVDLQHEVTTTTLPRYAMPNITSMLPDYGHNEQEFIGRAFNMANYDSIARLPTELHVTEVSKARRTAMEQARTMSVAPTDGIFTPHAVTKQGLFSEFQYVPSEYNLYNQLENKRIEESKAQIASVAGTDFKPAGHVCKGKYEDGFQDGGLYPYLCDPYEAAEETALRLKWIADAQALAGPWAQPGMDKVGEKPTRQLAGDMMAHVHKIIQEDWDEADIMIYPNDDELWVIRIVLDDGVDSVEGLTAYLNVLLRTNPLVLKYQLTKVVEHWNVQPGDGCVYYTVKPPWVAANTLTTFLTLHPEERNLKTLQAYREANEDQITSALRAEQRTERNWRGVVR